MKIVAIILFFLTVNFQVSEASSLAADASLWIHEKYSGKTCGDISSEDLSAIDQITDSKSLICKASNASSKSIQGLNDIAESVFFDRMAKSQFEETNCEISNIGHFENDDSLIRVRSDEISDRLPLIKEQIELANRAYFDFQQLSAKNNVFAGYCKNSEGTSRIQCFEELERKKLAEKEAESIWIQRRGFVTAIIGGLWNGNTEAMNEFILKLLKYDPLPSKEVLFNALRKRIPKVKAELDGNQADLVKQSTGSATNRKFNNLSDETKRKLVEDSAASGGILSEAATRKDESAIKFMCRLEGRYTKGRDSLNRTIGTATLLVGGAAGLISKIPLAVRAGQIGNVLRRAKSSAAVVGAIATGADAAIAVSALINKCFSDSFSHSVKNTCPSTAAEHKESEIKKIEQNNCVLDAAISVAPAGILASSKILKSFSGRSFKSAEAVGKESKASPVIAEKPWTIGPNEFAHPSERPDVKLVGKGNVGVISPTQFEQLDFPLANPGAKWGIKSETNYNALEIGDKVQFRDGIGKVVSKSGKKYDIRNPDGKVITLDLNDTNKHIGLKWKMQVDTGKTKPHIIEILDGVHGDLTTDFSKIDDIRRLVEQMPASEITGLKKIRIQDSPYKNNKALATASPDGFWGGGVMDIYTHPSAGLDLGISTFSHEFGHLTALKKFGNFDPPKSWTQAMKRDGRSVSQYADTNRAEDFAETYVAYMMAGNNSSMRRKYGNRFHELDKILTENPVLKQSLLTQYRSRLEQAGIIVAATASGVMLYQAGVAHFYPNQ